MRNIAVLFSVVSLIVLESSFAQAQGQFFWSDKDIGEGAVVGDFDLVVDELNPVKTVFLYFDAQGQDIGTGIELQFSFTVPYIVKFTAAETFEFDVLENGVPNSLRWGKFAGPAGHVDDNVVSSFLAFNIFKGAGLRAGNDGTDDFLDSGYDIVSGAFQIGSISVEYVQPGGTTIQLDQPVVVNDTIQIFPAFRSLVINGGASGEKCNPDSNRYVEELVGTNNVIDVAHGSNGNLYLLGLSGVQGNIVALDCNGEELFSAPAPPGTVAIAERNGIIYATGTVETQHLPDVFSDDVFVARLSTTDGSQLGDMEMLSSNSRPALGSFGNESATSIEVDFSGNVYITGSTEGVFDGNVATSPDFDSFVASYTENLSFRFVTQSGSPNSNEMATGIALGNVVYTSVNVHTGPVVESLVRAYTSTGQEIVSAPGQEGFPYRLTSPNGSNFASGVATGADATGQTVVYLTGNYLGFLAGHSSSNVSNIESNDGSVDVYIARFNNLGELQWLESYGTDSDENTVGISVDKSASSTAHLAYITGNTAGSLAGENSGAEDVFVARINELGDITGSLQFGSPTFDASTDICAVDGVAYLGGNTLGDINGDGMFSGGEELGFVARFNADQFTLFGDVNCDGDINILDIGPFVDLITNGGQVVNDAGIKADINFDGELNLLDIAAFVDLLISWST